VTAGRGEADDEPPAGWVGLVAGVVLTATGLLPARAGAGPSRASLATGPAAPTTTMATTSSGPTTTTTATTRSGSTTTTAETASSTTTTTLARSAPAGPSRTTNSAPSPVADPPGVLSISAPGLTNLGATGSGGRVVSARLGTVTVTDTRGVVDGAWTARVSATPFTTGGSSAGERVARSSILYWSGPATARSGIARLVYGQRRPSDAVRLTSTRVAFSATQVTGRNSASWVPTVVIRVPQAAAAGRYRGAIIHSVA
jgi:hypothetical protein